jgi:hypothetical protein
MKTLHITEKQLSEIKSNEVVVIGDCVLRSLYAPVESIEGTSYTIVLMDDWIDSLSTYGYFCHKDISITLLIDYNKPYRHYDISSVYSPYVPGVFA